METSETERTQAEGEIAALYRITQALMQADNERKMFERVLTEYLRRLNLRHGGILIVDNDKTYATLKALIVEGQPVEPGLRLPVAGRPIYKRLVENREPVVVNELHGVNFAEPTQNLLRDHGVKSLLLTPLVVQDEVIGALAADVTEIGREVTGREIELAGVITNQLSIAIENTRLYTETQRHALQLAVLHELNQAITSNLHLADVYYAFVRHASRLLPYDLTSIHLLEGDELRLAYAADKEGHVTPTAAGETIPRQGSALGWVVERGQPLLRHNLAASSRFIEDHQLIAWGLQSAMNIPLRVKGHAIGAWNIGSRQAGLYSPDDLAMAQAMADQLAAVIENARLYEQAQREIRERRQAEVALRESEERARQIIASIGDHIYVTEITAEGRRLNRYLSSNVENLTGYPLEKFTADWSFWFSTVIHPDDRALAAAHMTQLIKGRDSRVEYRITRADGAVMWVRDSARAEGESSSQIIYGVISDITEHKQLEEQFRQSQKMEALGQLAGGVAHDFNNLLTVINGYTELLLHRYPDADTPLRRDLEQIRQAGERAAALAHQLLAFSHKQALNLEVVDLNEVVAQMEKMLRRLIGEHIDLITVPEVGLGRVKADPAQLEQVIMNLAVNARDAMPRGGKLTIGIANVDLDRTYTRQHIGMKPGPYVLLTVSDTGHGMDRETKAHLFEPFFTTKEKGQGTGLGLATVHGIVRQSGGHIWVYSEPGRGTTFKIYLPRLEEAVESNRHSQTTDETPPGSETILLVEDEDIVRSLAYRILLEAGYTVLEAHQGAAARQICEQYAGPIHLLVTDVVMPGGMSGPELTELLKPLQPEMKVLYISGYPDHTIIYQGVSEAGLAFLEKPFTPKRLLRKVREVLAVKA